MNFLRLWVLVCSTYVSMNYIAMDRMNYFHSVCVYRFSPLQEQVQMPVCMFMCVCMCVRL